jgi:L-aminopeptidase/D-esterase-like protein
MFLTPLPRLPAAAVAALLAALAGTGGHAQVAETVSGITNVPGIAVGHFTRPERPTGCTVVLTGAQGAVASVDVRGGAPATRETDLLNPVNTVDRVHAIVLSGGSAFGLDAATGVMRYLEERGIGFDARVARVPIVPGASLFDLGIGDPTIRPTADCGYRAAAAAARYPQSAVGRIVGSPMPRSNRLAPGTMGTLATRASNPMPRSSR